MSEEGTDIDLEGVPPAMVRALELEPYWPERQRDWVRTIVTVGLLTSFLGLIFWACRQSINSVAVWTQTKDMLQIILPALSGLLGSVIGFYFGSGAGMDRKP